MSASSSNTSGGSTQPLADAIPWGSPVTLQGRESSDSIASLSCDVNDSATKPPRCKSTSRTLLVTDSLSTDARFLLHTLALQFLSSNSGQAKDTNNNSKSGSADINLTGSVLWISCGSPPVTEKQIAIGLRKALQHGLGCGADSNSSSNLGSVNVVSIPAELADAALQSETVFSHESYLKRLHRRIIHWLHHRELVSADKLMEKTNIPQTLQGPNLIIIDGVITLASLFGDDLTQMFISSVSASLKSFTKRSQVNENDCEKSRAIIAVTHLLAIRCTSPDDGGLYNIADLNEFEDIGSYHRTKGQKLRSEYSRLLRPWLGAGSSGIGSNSDIFHLEEQSHCLSIQTNETPPLLYNSGWYEMVDAVVDVSPLESGYARDVLGRLSFTTTWNGMGWWGVRRSSTQKGTSDNFAIADGGNYGSICVNYRCDDSGVRIMRLRSGK